MTLSAMRNAASRIGLVVFLTVSLSYQSWLITVPAERDILFAPAPSEAGKVIPSTIDIDDEHRSVHAVSASFPAALFFYASSLSQERQHNPLDLSSRPFNNRPTKRMHSVLLI